MKALVLYRSFHGNTKLVAEAIARELAAEGLEPLVQDLRQKLPDLNDFSFALVGAPTRMARVSRKALRVLKQLRKVGFVGKPVAIFDTYGPMPAKAEDSEKATKWISPGAAGIMERAAKDLGLNVYGKTLRCQVVGLNGPLADHEQEKAAPFVREFVSATRGKG